MYETNKYRVTPVNRHAQPVGASEKAKSYREIAQAKRRARGKLHKKRQKFDVYNESKKKFVNT
jgi:hypothetical protein